MSRVTNKPLQQLLGLALLVLLFAGGLFAATAWSAETQEKELALRGRVEEFYTLLLRRQWSQAELYVTEDSKESFRNESRSSFLGFEVESIQLRPGGQSATVVVQITTITQFAPTPIPFPQATEWRLVEDTWRVVVRKPDPNKPQSPFPFETKKTTATPPPEELAFEGHSYGLGVMQPGEVKSARFPFTNVTDHVVTITEVLTGCDCLRVKTKKMVYQPGESGVLAIEFDSTNYEYRYLQTIIVRTDPGNLTTHLHIGAQVIPRRLADPKPEQKTRQ